MSKSKFEQWVDNNYFFSGRSWYKMNSRYSTPYTLAELRSRFNKINIIQDGNNATQPKDIQRT